MAHAFGAAPSHPAELLIVLAPGIERFGYFRLLERLARGEASVDDLLACPLRRPLLKPGILVEPTNEEQLIADTS